ncbi:hypothetical protein GQX74_011471 [Glossina fuscipes]|nr:hypothetical protein GQX74_011471 [Glossina fuscipes]
MQKTVAHFMTLLRFTYLVKCLIINVKVERFGSFISSNALRIVSIPSSSLRLRPKRSYISCGINGAPSSRKNCFSKLVIVCISSAISNFGSREEKREKKIFIAYTIK